MSVTDVHHIERRDQTGGTSQHGDAAFVVDHADPVVGSETHHINARFGKARFGVDGERIIEADRGRTANEIPNCSQWHTVVTIVDHGAVETRRCRWAVQRRVGAGIHLWR